MVQYKLTYFNLKALGEPIRLLLTYLGKEFEDVRIEMKDWPKLKAGMPFGKLPVLEIDGKRICQSTAICRYLGKENNLAGKNNWESLEIDSLIDSMHDLRIEVAKYKFEPNPAAQEQKKEVLLKETVPFYLSKLDETIKKNGGHLVNGTLSWGDIYMASVLESLGGMLGMDLGEKYPNVGNLQKKVFTLPKIKEYIAKRPKSEF